MKFLSEWKEIVPFCSGLISLEWTGNPNGQPNVGPETNDIIGCHKPGKQTDYLMKGAVCFVKNMLAVPIFHGFMAMLTAFIATGLCSADDWPQWLGPKRDSVWRETGILRQFPESGPRLRWSVSIGAGYSGPAVAAGRVFLMDRIMDGDARNASLLHKGKPPNNQNFVRRLIPGKERIVCVRESDGKLLWTYQYDCPYTSVARYAIGPRVTPTIVGRRLFTLGAEGDLLALDVADGTVIWSHSFGREYGVTTPEWGFSSHPLVDGNRLICMVGGKGSTVVAFDISSGREIWRALDGDSPGYCSPMIYENEGIRQLIVWHGESVNSLDPDTGNLFWSLPVKPTYAMSIGAPRVENNILYLMSYASQSTAIELAPTAPTASILWTGNNTRGIGGIFNTPFLDKGYIYACGHNGRYACAELLSGKRRWTTFAPSTGKRPASWANVFTVKHADRFFLANDFGDLIIAKMDSTGYQEISRAHLIDPTHNIGDRDVVWSHPAFANRSVYLRNDREIRSYDLSGHTP